MLPLAAGVLALLVAGAPVAAAAPGTSVAGVVTDPTGAPVAGAGVTLLSPLGSIAATTRSDAAGGFRFEAVPSGSYVLSAELSGFATRRLAVQVDGARALAELAVRLQPETFRDEVTVTAAPGRADALDDVAQRVNVIGEEKIALRAKAVLAQAASEEVGLQLQRTSPTIGGVFVRGLTGTKVNVYVDGVRYTTSAQRGGVSTFFNLVEPETLEGIEVVRGPSSAEYGSDALGGTVQLLTRLPAFSAGGERVSGSWSASGGSADLSFGSALVARYAAPTFGLLGTLAGRRVNTLRAADGIDSRGAVTRFLGLPASSVIDGRLPDTAFTQYGGQLKANWALTPSAQLVMSYLRGQQDGGKRYDQLLGGDGNLTADLRNLMADHFYARFEKSRLGFLDRLTLSYSFSAQREERVNQGGNGNPRASVNHEPERSVANGLQAAAHRGVGRSRPHARWRRLLRDDGRAVLRDEPGDRCHHGPPRSRSGRPALPPRRGLPAGRLRGRAGSAALERRRALLRGLLRGGRRERDLERPAALARRLVRHERTHLSRGGALELEGTAEPGREREPRVPRARHHRPRHVRADRLGLRGLEPRGGRPRSERRLDRRRRGGEHGSRRSRCSPRRRASATSSPYAIARAG